MSTALLTSTSFIGMDITMTRTPTWQTRIQENVSGHETRVTYRTIPRYTWELQFNFIRNSTAYNSATVGSSEFSAFVDFFNNRSGSFDSFQWQDPEDNTGTLEPASFLNAGTFQLRRNLDGLTFNDPVYAPNNVTQVFIVNSSGQSSASTVGVTVNFWGSSIPGQIVTSTFSPTSSASAFVNFTYYWPVRFDKDTLNFERMMTNLWQLKKVSFTSII